jgi:hypothetical protein
MIPPKMRQEISDDPYYSRCAITGATHNIEWHHNLRWAGKNVQEKFCIIPLNKEIHAKINYHKEKVDWIMLNRMTDEELTRYSKADDLHDKKLRLNKKYGMM